MATVFVFEEKKKPYTTRVLYTEAAFHLIDAKNWNHTATIDPAAWIQYLLNNPGEREKKIEELCHKKKGATKTRRET